MKIWFYDNHNVDMDMSTGVSGEPSNITVWLDGWVYFDSDDENAKFIKMYAFSVHPFTTMSIFRHPANGKWVVDFASNKNNELGLNEKLAEACGEIQLPNLESMVTNHSACHFIHNVKYCDGIFHYDMEKRKYVTCKSPHDRDEYRLRKIKMLGGMKTMDIDTHATIWFWDVRIRDTVSTTTNKSTYKKMFLRGHVHGGKDFQNFEYGIINFASYYILMEERSHHDIVMANLSLVLIHDSGLDKGLMDFAMVIDGSIMSMIQIENQMLNFRDFVNDGVPFKFNKTSNCFSKVSKTDARLAKVVELSNVMIH